MQLVNEDDGVLRFHQLLHDCLQTFFELAAILGAGDNQREVEGQNALIREKGRYFAVRDALRQAFHDGRLAHARLSDEHGVVLGAATENLDDALQFAFAADQGIELRVHGGLGEVAGKFAEQRSLALPLGLRLLLAGAGQFFADRRQPQSALVQNFGGEALFFAQQTEQQVFGADVLMGEPLRFLGGIGQNPLAFIAEREVDRCGDLFPDRGVSFDLLADRFDRGMRAQETIGQSLVFAQKSQQQVLRLNIGRTELTGLIAREKNDAPGLLCITFKHIALFPSELFSEIGGSGSAPLPREPLAYVQLQSGGQPPPLSSHKLSEQSVVTKGT